MTDPRYAEARDLFLRCVDLDHQAQAAFLAEHCAHDPALAQEVTELLAADRDASPLDHPPLPAGIDESAWVGRTVSNYRVTGVLASGGMGVVFAGQQTNPARPVALKVIRSGLPSRQARRRFAREAEVLARLDHPGIAQIFEAGTADMGVGPQPFFAMELITGDPIDAYVARQELDVPATVALFVQVVAAVQHAHGQNVVHRDLKPANILVRPDGQVKVLDFGVARLTDTDLNATLQSEVGQILGTLPYMSPEQVRGHHHEIDGRTDVYAIGVALYQVLTGRLPLDLDEGNLASAVRRIEEDPARALVGRPGDPHHTYPTALATIVGKCLAKDPDQRYASAADLGADLQRFLDDQPIAARPPSTLEQARQFAARNRGLVTGLSVAAVILVVGCAVAVTGWVAADKARRLASREANRAEAVNSFLLDMLAAPDPWASGPEVKVVEVLDRAAARIDSSLASNAVAAAEAHATVATSYEGLAVYDKAGTHYRRAYTLTRGVDDVARRVRMLRNLVQFEIADGRLAEVDTLVVEMESELGQLASGSLPRAEALHVLGAVAEARGELATAEARFREALDISRTVLGPTDAATLATQLNLGVILMQEEQLAEARDLVTPVYETRRTRLGVEHPQTLIAVNNLAVIYRGLGRHEEALEMCRLSLAAREKVHGPVSPSAMVGEHNLGLQLGRMERFADALPHHERAVAIAEETLGSDHPRAWIARAALGRAQFQVGQLSAAEKTLSAAVAGLETHFGTDHWRTLAAAAHLAELEEGPAD